MRLNIPWVETAFSLLKARFGTNICYSCKKPVEAGEGARINPNSFWPYNKDSSEPKWYHNKCAEYLITLT